MKNSDKRVTFRFATLPNILSAVTGPLSAHGLTLVGSTTGTKVIQYLEHVSGAKRRAWLKLPDNNEAMGLQEEISKRRRYMIIVLLTLAVEEREQKDKRQRRGTSRVRGQATPAAKPQGRPDGAAKSEPKGAGETAKPVTAGSTRPAAAARPQAPAAEPAQRSAPPPAGIQYHRGRKANRHTGLDIPGHTDVTGSQGAAADAATRPSRQVAGRSTTTTRSSSWPKPGSCTMPCTGTRESSPRMAQDRSAKGR